MEETNMLIKYQFFTARPLGSRKRELGRSALNNPRKNQSYSKFDSQN